LGKGVGVEGVVDREEQSVAIRTRVVAHTMNRSKNCFKAKLLLKAFIAKTARDKYYLQT
jgi:hypothetical protein